MAGEFTALQSAESATLIKLKIRSISSVIMEVQLLIYKIKQKIWLFLDLADIYQEQNWLDDLARRTPSHIYRLPYIRLAYGEPTGEGTEFCQRKERKIEQEELIYESCGHVRGTHARLCSIQTIRMHRAFLRMPLRRRSY